MSLALSRVIMHRKADSELETEFFKLDSIRARHLERMNRIMTKLQEKSEPASRPPAKSRPTDFDDMRHRQWRHSMATQLVMVRREMLQLSHRIDLLEKSLNEGP